MEITVDWSLVLTASATVLNGLALYFWKPWAGGYGGEKGKNLARKEDIDKILSEVRVVTEAQKTIEAKISGDLWRRQMCWNQKRDMYVEGMALADKVSLLWIGVEARLMAQESESSVREQRSEITRVQTELSRIQMVSMVFGNIAANHAFKEYWAKPASVDGETKLQHAERHALQAQQLALALCEAAKADLRVE